MRRPYASLTVLPFPTPSCTSPSTRCGRIRLKRLWQKDWDLIPPYAIESIQTFAAEEQIKQGKNITFCKSPKDIIIMRTNSLAELQWVINGKLRKPRKKLTIIDYKLSPQRITEALPKGIKPTDILSADILTYVNDPRQEKHPTIVIKTKKPDYQIICKAFIQKHKPISENE